MNNQNITYRLLYSVSLFLLLPYLSFAQTGEDVSLEEFLFEIQQTYHISIICDHELLAGRKMPRDFDEKGKLEKILKEALKVHELELNKIDERNYFIVKGKKYEPLAKPEVVEGTITGRIKDETGEPLQGVHIYIPQLMIGTFTNEKGSYGLKKIPEGNYAIEFSYMGYVKEKEVFKITTRHQAYEFNYTLEPDLLSLQTIIITGVTHPIVNLESGVAATSISENEINEIAPRSVADVLQKIPGFYLETSSGEISNSLYSRGMPSEGSYQYVTFQEDGLTIYDGGNIDWMPADMFYRVDATLEYVEGVRSGSSSIFSSNAPGGIINFMSKTGGSKRKGSIKIQTADFGQLRAEGEIGGSIMQSIHYHIGGYYRIDNGIRKPGFTANKGGQVKGSITKIFNNGYIRLSGKYLNDKNIYYSSIPLQQTEKPSSFNNFDPNYGTMTSVNAQKISLPTPIGEETHDLSDGIHTNLGYIGTHAKFDLGDGWTIDNKNRVSLISNNGNAILSVFSPVSAFEYAQNKKNIPTGTTPKFTYVDDGSAFDLLLVDNYVVEAGWLVNEQFMYNLINSFEVSKQTEKFQVLGNIYLSSLTNTTVRRWGNILLEVNGEEPRPLNLAYYNPDGSVNTEATNNGFTNYQLTDSYLNAQGSALIGATYLYGKYNLNKKSFVDGGFRLESLQANGAVQDTAILNLNESGQNNVALANVLYGDSTYTPYKVRKITYACTVGYNLLLGDKESIFARGSKGFRMPDFDNWHQNKEIDGGLIEDIWQLEFGYKHASKKYAVLFSSFFSYIGNQVTTLAIYDENEIKIPHRTRDARTFGVEIESVFEVMKGLSIDLTATLQKATYIVEASQEIDPDYRVNGNNVKRIPNVYFIFKPTYEIKSVKIFGTAQYIGERYSDEINTDVLPEFLSLNLGVSYKYKGYNFLVHAQNLTNQIGLTDGNPRILADNRNEPARMARPILGRSIVASATYQF